MKFSKNASLLGFLALAVLVGAWLIFLPEATYNEVNTKTHDLKKTIKQNQDLPTITSTVVVDGLEKPWDVGFLPDSSIIYTEKAGTISLFSSGKKTQLHKVDNIFNSGEGGLLGLAVDRDHKTNRFIYACYSTLGDIRVSRWKIAEDNSSLTDQKDIITGISVKPEAYQGRHSGCRLEFSKNDDSLWVGTGDVAEGTFPQDPKSLAGKILHVDRDGAPVAGNLGEPFDPRIYNYGHRNVQGLVIFDQMKLGSMGYTIEHGTGRDDEVNELRPGNFGWDPIPGYNEATPMTDKTKFPNAIDAIWSSGNPTVAPSGADTITGSNWKVYNGALAVAVLKDKHLMVLRFNQKGQVISEQRLFKNEFGRLRSVNSHPSGDLYISTDNGGGKDQIIKLSAN